MYVSNLYSVLPVLLTIIVFCIVPEFRPRVTYTYANLQPANQNSIWQRVLRANYYNRIRVLYILKFTSICQISNYPSLLPLKT